MAVDGRMLVSVTGLLRIVADNGRWPLLSACLSVLLYLQLFLYCHLFFSWTRLAIYFGIIVRRYIAIFTICLMFALIVTTLPAMLALDLRDRQFNGRSELCCLFAKREPCAFFSRAVCLVQRVVKGWWPGWLVSSLSHVFRQA